MCRLGLTTTALLSLLSIGAGARAEEAAGTDEVVVSGVRHPGGNLVVHEKEVFIQTAPREGRRFRLDDVSSFAVTGSRKVMTAAGDVFAITRATYDGERFRLVGAVLGELTLEATTVRSIAFKDSEALYSKLLGGYLSKEGQYVRRQPWKGSLGLTYVATTGAADAQMFSLAFDANTIRWPWRSTVSGKTSLGASAGARTADASEGSYELDRFFSPRSYGCLQAKLFHDGIADVDVRATAGPGMGYRFLLGPMHEFAGEAGYEYFHEALAGGGADSESFARLGLEYRLFLRDDRTFSEKLDVMLPLGGDRVRLRSETALSAGLTKRLQVKLGFVAERDTAPPLGQTETTSRTETALVWTF